MDEIEGRFELIRIAAQLGDYEVIDTQIRRLRNMSTDRHLHDILHELEDKNFRQALYMMRDYAESLQDDFFNPPIAKSTPRTSPRSTPRHLTTISSPSFTTSSVRSTRSSLSSVMWQSPSRFGRMVTKAPKSVILATVPTP